MIKHLHILFLPHDKNNHKPKILHLSSLSILLIIVILFQLLITAFHWAKPGVLGFAANIDPQNIVSLTNSYRGQNGLGNLTLNEKLSEAAREKASDMFAKNYWAHYSPSGTTPWWFFDNVDYSYLYAGENLARDFGDSETVIKAWLASPTHRDNLLSPKYQDIGVAVVNGLLNGEETTLVVQLFGTKATAPAISKKAEAKGISQPAAESLKPTNQIFLSENLALATAPIISSFLLTKIVSLSLLVLLLLVLALDSFLIWRARTLRISGRSFIHFSFLAIILAIMILVRNGQII